MSPSRKIRNANRRGVALYLVAIVVMILSLGALALVVLMQTEHKATALRGDEIQSQAAAQSGVEMVRAFIALPEEQRRRLGGLDDNPRYFAAVEICSAKNAPPKGAFRVTVLSPKLEDERVTGIRYGLTNESARLHLESVLQWELETPGAGRRALMRLPRMTPTIADSILDWLDADKTARSSGAELDYYVRSGAPYGPRNAIPVSLDELLLVREMQRNLLYGNDEHFSYGFDAKPSSDAASLSGLSSTPSFSPPSEFPEQEFTPETEPEFGTIDSPLFAPKTVSPQIGNENDPPQIGPGGIFALPPEGESEIQTSDEFSAIPDLSNTPEDAAAIPSSSREIAVDPGFGVTPSGSSGLPWMYLLTTLSAEKEVNPQGVAKFNLNENDLEFLYEQISKSVDAQAASFVVLYRMNGPAAANAPSAEPVTPPVTQGRGGRGAGGGRRGGSALVPDFTQGAKFTLDTPLDLLNVNVEGAAQNPFSLTDSRRKNRFIRLLQHGTVSPEVVITGRVNINEAPREVLLAIPGMNEQIVSRVVSTRRSLVSANRSNELQQPTWLVTENVLDLATLKTLWDKITVGGDVYRCQVVGFLEGQGTNSRYEIVVDATVSPPRQVFFKDLTMYGRVYPERILVP